MTTGTFEHAEQLVDAIIARVGKHIVLGLPLGLGKPLHVVNALYQRAQRDQDIELHIVTALSLVPPVPGSFLEKRFLSPFLERLYGDIPTLAYARDLQQNQLPDNVKVSEFFFQAGAYLDHPGQQQHYICTNYTHALRDLQQLNINVLAQLVAPHEDNTNDCLSLSCNPDLTLDLMHALNEKRSEDTPIAFVAECTRELPYFGKHAALPATAFDLVLDTPKADYPLFSVPQEKVEAQDHLIGFYASTLLKDNGTLQIGIGSLSTALVHSLLLRHQNNALWQQLYEQLKVARRFPVVRHWGGTEPFEAGLYGCSEMMVDGFIYLLEAGILKRRVKDPEHAQGIAMHAGFFLGSRHYYHKLNQLSDSQRAQICMTSVNYINDLYDHRLGSQAQKVSQRQHARFINSAMQCTVDGAAISDALEDGRIVSGVGGQYNFVAMAHELADARSIITLRSTREANGETLSNICFSYGHCTIPRHLRDIVITEYGIADLRGKCDEDVYLELIRISDARFQPALFKQAQDKGKIRQSLSLPPEWQDNTPAHIRQQLKDIGSDNFPPFPFDCDFTDEELELGRALKWLQAHTASRKAKLMLLARALFSAIDAAPYEHLLQRMELDKPQNKQERLYRKMLLYALRES